MFGPPVALGEVRDRGGKGGRQVPSGLHKQEDREMTIVNTALNRAAIVVFFALLLASPFLFDLAAR
jgi:hypothetical protein